MKSLLMGVSLSVSFLVGCETVVPSVTTVKKTETERTVQVQDEEKKNERKWSTNKGDLAVYPATVGPTDMYRPVYKISEGKVAVKGVGPTEKDALDEAILRACLSNRCDYIAAAKTITNRITDKNGTKYEVFLVGFPATLTSVETIPVKFYERQPDGTLKEMKHPETRYVLDAASNTWSVASIMKTPVDKGGDVKGAVRETVVKQPAQPYVNRPLPVREKHSETTVHTTTGVRRIAF